ncbi:hypothetical protein PP224_gp26 [Streptococcus phage D4276]|uniref:Uncharacterized protein n=1 Tax=Streptococcus phage D4276 TaxID=2006928 RepID=A0A220G9R4_9CAUD|nr:hypothetical protein PP224_gp26 [Streptococcus phage D4276]ASD50986.1 hypothetical protein D4276_026 [Streptococcus phage D4276]
MDAEGLSFHIYYNTKKQKGVLTPNKMFPFSRDLNLISLSAFALDKLYLGYPITFYKIIIYKSNKKSPSKMLRLRPLLPWYPYCSVRGGDILLFIFLVSVVYW